MSGDNVLGVTAELAEFTLAPIELPADVQAAGLNCAEGQSRVILSMALAFLIAKEHRLAISQNCGGVSMPPER